MSEIMLNTIYLRSTRAIIKMLQIISGFIVCSLLCGKWYGGNTCINEGRLGYSSTLNAAVVLVNIGFFLLNIINLSFHYIERIYSIVAMILFLIAAVLVIWLLLQDRHPPNYMIAAIVFIAIIFFLFLWDVKILQGESANMAMRTLRSPL